MLGNANIPISTAPNRRTARRLLRYCIGATEAGCTIALIAWFVFAPRPTETAQKETISVWVPNTAQAKSAMVEWLQDSTLEQQAAAHVLQHLKGPWTLVWNTNGELVNITTPTQSEGEKIATRNRWWPKYPWHTGVITMMTEDKGIRATYTYTKKNEVVINGTLLAPATMPITEHVRTGLTISPPISGKFWQPSAFPLTFPGFRTLAERARNTESGIHLRERDRQREIQLTVNAFLSNEEANAVMQDMIRGSENIHTINTADGSLILNHEKNGVQTRLVRTPHSISLTRIEPTITSRPPSYCRSNAKARIQNNIFNIETTFQNTQPDTTLIIETVRGKTIICRKINVDNLD